MVRTRRALAVLAVAVVIVGIVVGVAAALDAEGERLPDGIVGQPYEADLEASGGCVPYTFKHDSGYLPPGLTIDGNPTYSTGKIEGTPTASGWWDFYLEVTDICGSKPSQEVWTMFVHPALVITTTTLPPTRPGVPYSAKLTAESGDASVLEWSLAGGSLPAGLTLFRDGAIGGTATTAGVSSFVVKVHDGNVRTTTKELSIAVGAQLAASGPSTQVGEVGVRFRSTLRATGGVAPHSWSVATGSLPRGLALNAASGEISGVPAAPGTSALTFAVTDAAGARATTASTLRVAARLRIANASALPSATKGSRYRTRLAASGGQTPVRWARAAGAFPAGITLNARTGVLSGRPASAGTYRFTLRATDALGGTSRKAFRLVVAP